MGSEMCIRDSCLAVLSFLYDDVSDEKSIVCFQCKIKRFNAFFVNEDFGRKADAPEKKLPLPGAFLFCGCISGAFEHSGEPVKISTLRNQPELLQIHAYCEY